jgi:hypothetical protein
MSDSASLDEELDAQLARMREMLKLMAPEGGTAGALGAPGKARSDARSRELARDPADKSR